jgi:hypothetical protein
VASGPLNKILWFPLLSSSCFFFGAHQAMPERQELSTEKRLKIQ